MGNLAAAQQFDARSRLEKVSCPVAEIFGDQHAQLQIGVRVKRSDDTERDQLRSGHHRTEAASVDRDRQCPERRCRDRQRPGQRIVPGVADLVEPRIEVGMAPGPHPLVPGLATVTEHEHVVGHHVAQPVDDAPLSEVGTRRLVAAAHQLERAPADVHAVVEACRDVRPQPQRDLAHRSCRAVDGEPIRQAGRRAVAVGHREDRAVVGQRGRGGDARFAVRGLPQRLEPAVGDDHVARQQHDVGGSTRPQRGAQRLHAMPQPRADALLYQRTEARIRERAADQERDARVGVLEHAPQAVIDAVA